MSSRVVPDDAKAVMRCETTEPGAAEKVGGCCSSCRGVEFDIDASLLPATLWQFSTRLAASTCCRMLRVRSRSMSSVRALVLALGTRSIPVAGRDDLIRMKRAAGRPIDLEDIAALTEPEHRDGGVRRTGACSQGA